MSNLANRRTGASEAGGVELAGRCACGKIRYRLGANPLIVHACHCRDCQRITGGAFVLNLWIERKFVTREGPEPKSCRPRAAAGNRTTCFSAGIAARICGASITARRGMRYSSARARWSIRRLCGRPCIFSRAASCRGCNFRPGRARVRDVLQARRSLLRGEQGAA